MKVVNFTLKPIRNSNSSISVEAHVEDGPICAPLDEINLDCNDIDYLSGLQLADPIPRGNATVDVLLGDRYYSISCKVK